jgi:hypothetical protein
MAPAAQITSVEAIENFRARLIVYLGQMRPLLEEISHEALQTRLWIQNDQQRFWQDQEHEKFSEEFKQAIKALKKFVETSREHTPFLLRKAQRIEEYLNQR